MNTNFTSTLAGLLLVACTSGYRHGNEDVSGTYVRQYSIEVVNLETNQRIGMRTIRDTIFVRPLNDEVEISNNKWMMNDYDREGWRNMNHDDDRPFSSYKAIHKNGVLSSPEHVDLHWDIKTGRLFKGKQPDFVYKKIE